MILIVGHGPSSAHVSHDFVNKHRVVRLRRAIPFVGTRTDVICSSQQRYEQKGVEFWLLQNELYQLCEDTLLEFKPDIIKPSTGLSAVIIARDIQPNVDIGVIGFDYTLHPHESQNWRHDQFAECECLKTMNVIEFGD